MSPTAAQNIQTAINNYAATLAAISASPQPSYSVQGISMTFTEYQSFIVDKMGELNELLVVLSGPYQLVSVGIP